MLFVRHDVSMIYYKFHYPANTSLLYNIVCPHAIQTSIRNFYANLMMICVHLSFVSHRIEWNDCDWILNPLFLITFSGLLFFIWFLIDSLLLCCFIPLTISSFLIASYCVVIYVTWSKQTQQYRHDLLAVFYCNSFAWVHMCHDIFNFFPVNSLTDFAFCRANRIFFYWFHFYCDCHVDRNHHCHALIVSQVKRMKNGGKYMFTTNESNWCWNTRIRFSPAAFLQSLNCCCCVSKAPDVSGLRLPCKEEEAEGE